MPPPIDPRQSCKWTNRAYTYDLEAKRPSEKALNAYERSLYAPEATDGV